MFLDNTYRDQIQCPYHKQNFITIAPLAVDISVVYMGYNSKLKITAQFPELVI